MKVAQMTRMPEVSDSRAAIRPRRLLPVAALFAAVLLWGGSFAAMRLAVQAMSPWSVMWLRMAIALAIILPFAGRLKTGAYRRGGLEAPRADGPFSTLPLFSV